MPVLFWRPSVVTGPLQAAFQPAVAATTALAKSTAPGPETSAKTKLTIQAAGGVVQSATVDALGVGPEIFPIVSGSSAGLRTTTGWFVIPGGPVVQTIDHPGTPPHDWLSRAAAAFIGLYQAAASRSMALFR